VPKASTAKTQPTGGEHDVIARAARGGSEDEATEGGGAAEGEAQTPAHARSKPRVDCWLRLVVQSVEFEVQCESMVGVEVGRVDRVGIEFSSS